MRSRARTCSRATVALSRKTPAKWRPTSPEGRQEGLEPLDRGYGLPSLSGEVEAARWGDRSMQQCPPGSQRGSCLPHRRQGSWRVPTREARALAGGIRPASAPGPPIGGACGVAAVAGGRSPPRATVKQAADGADDRGVRTNAAAGRLLLPSGASKPAAFSCRHQQAPRPRPRGACGARQPGGCPPAAHTATLR